MAERTTSASSGRTRSKAKNKASRNKASKNKASGNKASGNKSSSAKRTKAGARVSASKPKGSGAPGTKAKNKARTKPSAKPKSGKPSTGATKARASNKTKASTKARASNKTKGSSKAKASSKAKGNSRPKASTKTKAKPASKMTGGVQAGTTAAALATTAAPGVAADANPPVDHTEVAALRRQVADLTAQLTALEARVPAPVATPAPVQPGGARRAGRGRTVAAVALVVVASLLVPVSITATWLRNRVVDTDGYVATVAPLARNADIQAAAGDRIATALFSSTDVEGTVARLLPGDAAVLAVPLTASLRALADQAIVAVLASDQFATLWDEVHRLAHAQLVSALTGNGTTGTVAVDLAPVVKVVAERLDTSGLALFDRAGNTPVLFEVLSSDDLARVQASFRLYDRLATALPWVTLLLLAAAVVVARDRRRMLVGAAVGVALGAAVLLLAITAGRWYYLASLPAGVSLAASEAFFDTLARFLVSGARFVLTLAVVVGVAAVVAGPSPSAVRLRRFVAVGMGRAATEVDQRGGSGRVGAFVAANHTALRVAVAVAVAVVLIAADRPTGTMVLWLAAGSLVALGVLDVLARTGTRTSVPAVADPVG